MGLAFGRCSNGGLVLTPRVFAVWQLCAAETDDIINEDGTCSLASACEHLSSPVVLNRNTAALVSQHVSQVLQLRRACIPSFILCSGEPVADCGKTARLRRCPVCVRV